VFAAQLQTAQNTAEDSTINQPDENKKNPVLPSPTPTPEIPHNLVGAYYDMLNYPNAKLLLNNKGDLPLEVQPTLYNLQGQELQLPTVTVAPQNFRFINLSDWAGIGGESYRSGNIKLFHYGKDLVLGAQIYLTDEPNSISFEEKLAELTKFDSRKQEAVWWMPSNQADVKVVLTNTTNVPLAITGTLSRKPHHVGSPQTFQLAAHETKILDLRTDFVNGNQFTNSELVGLSFEHCAVKDALLARVMIKETNRGYSNFAQFSNPDKGKSSEYQGVGFQIEDIGSDIFTPIIVARNVGAETANVNTKISYTLENGTKGIVTLPQERLRSNEMSLLKTQKITQLVRRENVKVASLEVEYNTSAGSVIVASHTVSNNRNQVFRVPMWDPLAQRSPTGGYPWRIEDTSQTETYIKNITDQEQDYVAFLVWENGGMYMIGLKPIAAHETINIDVKQLRDEQIPDEQGRTIPQYISSGQLQWTLRRKDNLPDDDTSANLALIGRSEQVDITKGIVNNYACQNCCVGNFSFGYVLPGDREIEFGDNIQYRAYEEGETCYGSRYLYQITNPQWSSSNQSVATITGAGVATSQGIGETNIRANWRTTRYRETEPCPPEGPLLWNNEDTFGGCGRNSIKKQIEINNLLPECGTCVGYSSPISSNSYLSVKPKIRILRDGTDITSTPQNQNIQNVIVGQRINLSATVQGGTVSNQQWTIPEKILGEFETLPAGRTPTTARVVPVVGLNTSSTNFAWYSGGGTDSSKSVKYTVTINGMQFEGLASFNVKRPSTSMTANGGTTKVDNVNPFLYLGGVSSADSGIIITRGSTTIPDGFNGNFQFVQLISGQVVRTAVGGSPAVTSLGGLDGCYPYILGETSMSDTPGFSLAPLGVGALQYGEYNGQWVTYLMFKPTGADSVWVPLKKLNWAWHGTATLVPASSPPQWTLNNIMPPGNPVGVDTTEYPIWNRVQPDQSGDNCTTIRRRVGLQ
jgi:hypothetical protein